MNQKTFSDLHEHLLIEFDGLSNLDSSIWLFEDASTKAEWLVLGGDAVLSGWQRLLAKERLSPYALKISHHGKEDALNGWLLQEISPAWLLITTNYCDYEKHYHRWETLSGSEKCSLFVLGHDQKTRWLEAELPGEPQKNKKGASYMVQDAEGDRLEENVNNEKILEFAEKLALLSGSWMAEQRRNTITLEYDCKSNHIDLVTRFDREVEQIIVKQIKEFFPHHLILGEESTEQKDFSMILHNKETCWVIDPLDGTMNFVHCIPHFAVSIAAVKNGIPLVGVVYDPNRNELFSAARGLGTRLNGKVVAASKQDDLKNSLLSTGFAADDWHRDNPSRLEIQKVFGHCRSIRISGSSALDLAYISAGRIDGFWHRKLVPWDIAAGILLVEEAGGKVSSLDGKFFQFTDDYLIASNGLIQNEINGLLTKTELITN